MISITVLQRFNTILKEIKMSINQSVLAYSDSKINTILQRFYQKFLKKYNNVFVLESEFVVLTK